MKNLAAVVTKEAILDAINDVETYGIVLRKSTRFHLIFNSKAYPPKEIVRQAAKRMGIHDLDNYRLAGGKSANAHLIKKGFQIITHNQWVTKAKPIVEKRVARICWNDKSWIEPSGTIGKSNDKNSHEYKFGYGHEEWLFDTSKIINGYHYAFLEPVRKQHQAYQNKTYNIWLYSINGETKQRYFIGEINNAIVIDEVEAEKIYKQYQKNGWIDEMTEQIRLSQANKNGLSGFLDEKTNLFNIKFKPLDIDFTGYIELPKNHEVSRINRYSLSLFKDDYYVITAPKAFEFLPPKSLNNKFAISSTKIVRREPKEIEIKNLHKVISDNLVHLLRKKYGNNNVTPEHPTSYGMKRIDIVLKDKSKLIFYEIKTYSSLQTSIREAFGQIMEYAHWINANNANELIIVTQLHSKLTEALTYIKHLRTIFSIPIYLQMFDVDENKLLVKY